MTRQQNTVWCDNCGVEITWAPVVTADKRDYCCQDCRHGLKCACGERQELDERRRAGETAAPEPSLSD